MGKGLEAPVRSKSGRVLDDDFEELADDELADEGYSNVLIHYDLEECYHELLRKITTDRDALDQHIASIRAEGTRPITQSVYLNRDDLNDLFADPEKGPDFERLGYSTHTCWALLNNEGDLWAIYNQYCIINTPRIMIEATDALAKTLEMPIITDEVPKPAPKPKDESSAKKSIGILLQKLHKDLCEAFPDEVLRDVNYRTDNAKIGYLDVSLHNNDLVAECNDLGAFNFGLISPGPDFHYMDHPDETFMEYREWKARAIELLSNGEKTKKPERPDEAERLKAEEAAKEIAEETPTEAITPEIHEATDS